MPASFSRWLATAKSLAWSTADFNELTFLNRRCCTNSLYSIGSPSMKMVSNWRSVNPLPGAISSILFDFLRRSAAKARTLRSVPSILALNNSLFNAFKFEVVTLLNSWWIILKTAVKSFFPDCTSSSIRSSKPSVVRVNTNHATVRFISSPSSSFSRS